MARTNPFGLPDIRFVPEVDELPVTLSKMKKIIEWINDYNLQCRLGAKYDKSGDEIPVQYVGRNRYWIHQVEGRDETIGEHTLFAVYELDPSTDEKRILLCRYVLVDSRGDFVQTAAQARKHLIASRLDAERKERMAKADPKLTDTIKIHMPSIYKPSKAIEKAGRI